MEKKSLKVFLDMLKENNLIAEYNVPAEAASQLVSDVSYNSMDVGEGTLFICKGLNFKNEYLEDAMKKGAFCYVAEKVINADYPYIIVNNMRQAMSDLGAMFYDSIWNDKLKMIGITGTKGKSTTATFVKSIMDDYCKSAALKEMAFISGIYIYDGHKKRKSNGMTTPETLDLHKILNTCVENGCEYLAMETSSQGLKYDRTRALKYKVGGFLNISEDHISDREHPNMEDYFSSKLKILQQSEIACVNSDIDAEFLDIIMDLAHKSCKKVITFGCNEDADYYGYDIKSTSGQHTFKLRCEGREEAIVVNIGGTYNASNSLAAIAMTRALGVPFDNIKRGLANVKVTGRMELYQLDNKPVDVIVDHAHNKMSYEALFKHVKEFYPGKKMILVAGCVGDKAYNRRQELGELAGEYADYVILAEKDSGKEPFEIICQQIMEHIKSDVQVEVIADKDEAVIKAFSMADENSVVVVCAGTGSEEIVQRNI